MKSGTKLWSAEVLDEADDDEKAKIIEARQRFQYATTKEVFDLLDRVVTEMNACTKPYKIHR